MEIKSIKTNFLFSSLFLFLLFIVQSPYILNDSIGIFSKYLHNSVAFNEFTYWSQFQSEIFALMEFNNPMFYNLIGATIFLLSKIFSSKVIFTIFPIFLTGLAFFLFLKVLDEYHVPKHWALLLAFLGLTSSTSITLWDSVSNITNASYITPSSISLTDNHIDLLASFSTSFSLCFFLALLLATIKLNQLHYLPSKTIGLLWGLSAFIHPSIFFFGFIFIVLNFFLRFKKASKSNDFNNFKKALKVFLIPSLLILPYLYLNLSFYSGHEYSNTVQFDTFLRETFTYCIFPFGLMYLVSLIYRVDPYEITLRYFPILALSIGELVLRSLSFINIIFFDAEFILDNIAVYFLHFFYYAPLLSILSRSQYYEFKNQSSLTFFISQIRTFLFIFTKIIYLPLLIFFCYLALSPLLYKSPLLNQQFSSEYERLNNKVVDIKAQHAHNLNSDSNKIYIYDSMENNLISNLLYRDNPYLNSFLLNGPNNPSVFHAFFLNYFQSSHISSENGIKTEQVMNLMEVNERLFDWLTFNRYLKRKDLSEHSFNKEDLCSEEFFDLFEFIKTPVVLHQAFTHPDGSSIDTLLCGKEI